MPIPLEVSRAQYVTRLNSTVAGCLPLTALLAPPGLRCPRKASGETVARPGHVCRGAVEGGGARAWSSAPQRAASAASTLSAPLASLDKGRAGRSSSARDVGDRPTRRAGRRRVGAGPGLREQGSCSRAGPRRGATTLGRMAPRASPPPVATVTLREGGPGRDVTGSGPAARLQACSRPSVRLADSATAWASQGPHTTPLLPLLLQTFSLSC